MRAGLWLLRQCLPPRRALLSVAGWTAAEAAPVFLSGLAVSRATDSFIAEENLAAIAFLAFFGVAIVVGALSTRALYTAVGLVVEETRDGLMSKVARGCLARAGASGRSAAAPLTQFIDQVDKIRNILSALLRSMRSTVAPLVAACVGMFFLRPVLGIVVAVPLLAALGIYAFLLPRTVARYRSAAIAEEEFGAETTSVVADLPALRGLNADVWARDSLTTGALRVAAADDRMVRMDAIRHLIVAVGGLLPLLGVVVMAGPLIDSGQLTAGELVGATTYVMTALVPALNSVVTTGGGWFVQMMVLLDRIAIMAEVPTPSVPVPPTLHRTGKGVALEASSLTFAFRPGSKPVVLALDLQLLDGELLAVVGASGVGKSTFCELIAGLIAPTSGFVGVAPGRTMCFVPQHSYVFAGTLRENLTYLAADDITDAELNGCLREMGLGKLLERLGGLDSFIRPNAAGLSDEERQCVVLARAHLSGADILVLDEATSRLDPSAECRIEKFLRQTGRTVVVVAHRPDVTMRADKVLHFDGSKSTVGAHHDLMAASQVYRQLFRPTGMDRLAERQAGHDH